MADQSEQPDLASQMQQLYQRFGNLPGVHIELHQNLLAVYVQTPKAEARVFLQGAQVSHFQPKGQPPVLWLSEHNQYQVGKPLRGGIPISWPWFADLARNPADLRQQVTGDDAPAHGFVRNCDWQLDDIVVDKDVYHLHLSCRPQSKHWPYACRLGLVVSVDEALTLALSVTNLSDRPWRYALALHSYFQVEQISEVTVPSLAGQAYLDCLTDWQPCQQQDALEIGEEVDRVYTQAPKRIALQDAVAGRSIVLTSQNLPSLVAWNPWQEKGSRLSQFGTEDHNNMLCLENAALLDDAVTVAPKEKQVHTLKIESSRQLIH
ncbi:D-hexose-6-phosphate mutarotase [Halioxenophilus aromaticivorans]|uniref:Putative glucose-6-phosphate 1-epimerase n=1 Tax=Halioxenophilus aromaticivorans TaxID=1306992 RepID=A0AAV3U505_9ALTE